MNVIQFYEIRIAKKVDKQGNRLQATIFLLLSIDNINEKSSNFDSKYISLVTDKKRWN